MGRRAAGLSRPLQRLVGVEGEILGERLGFPGVEPLGQIKFWMAFFLLNMLLPVEQKSEQMRMLEAAMTTTRLPSCRP